MLSIPNYICLEPTRRNFPKGRTEYYIAYGRYYKFDKVDSNGNYCYALTPVLAGAGRKKSALGGCTDPDAKAFFAAVVANGGSLTSTEKSAICQYVKDLKAANIWDSDIADYPMVGGSLNSCQINLKTPGTYNLTFVNTVAGDFTSNGWNPNGTNSYARTGLNPSVVTPEFIAMEYYSREDSNGAFVDMGSYDGTRYALLSANLSTVSYFFGYNASPAPANAVAGALSKGQFIGGIRDEGGLFNQRLYKNGIQIAVSSEAGGTYPNFEIYLGTYNSSGSPAAAYTNRQCAGSAVLDGTSFDATKALAFYNARQTMNTTLGRQV